jgi:hypothetical protein
VCRERASSERVRRFSDRSLKRAVKAAALADEKLDVILGPREERVMKHDSRADMQRRLDAFSRGEYIPFPARFNLPTGEAEVKKRRQRMRADPHLSDSPGEISNIAVETRAPTRSATRIVARQHVPPREKTFPSPISISSARSVTN